MITAAEKSNQVRRMFFHSITTTLCLKIRHPMKMDDFPGRIPSGT